MVFDILEINRKDFLKRVNEYLDNFVDKKELNTEIKKIFNTKSAMNCISIRYAVMALKGFEQSGSSIEKVISNFISSIDLSTGQNLYEYEFFTEIEDDKFKVKLKVERKDNKTEYYFHYIEEALKVFRAVQIDIQELSFNNIKDYIDLMYKFYENYLKLVYEGKIEFDEEHFLKELIYILGDANSNDIYEELNGHNKK